MRKNKYYAIFWGETEQGDSAEVEIVEVIDAFVDDVLVNIIYQSDVMEYATAWNPTRGKPFVNFTNAYLKCAKEISKEEALTYKDIKEIII